MQPQQNQSVNLVEKKKEKKKKGVFGRLDQDEHNLTLTNCAVVDNKMVIEKRSVRPGWVKRWVEAIRVK